MSKAIIVQGGDYEHVAGFGAAGIGYQVSPLAALSRTVLGGAAFDVAEYSLANFLMLKDRGDTALAAIPVFPSRAFRNASVFVRADSPLHDLRQLAGKRVGISDFAMTTAVWTRGHLADTCGLDWRDIDWVTGPSPRFPAPAGVRTVESGGDLETALLDGEIDALMAGRPRDMQLPPSQRQLRFVAEDTEAIERAYYHDTGLFPIMHTVVLHADVVTNIVADTVADVGVDSGAARRVFDCYVDAKRTALKRRLGTTLLPFADRRWDEFVPPGGADPYQHGLTALNRRNIATLARYLREQGLIEREPDLDTLFVAGSADWLDI